MNSLERVQAVMAGQIPDRVPICLLGFMNAPRFAGMSMREYCLSGTRMAEAQLAYWEEFRHDVIDVESGIAAMAQAVGCAVEYPEDEPPWVVEPAIGGLEEIDTLPQVDPYLSPSLAELIRATEILRARLASRGREPVCIRTESDQGPFSLACQILGAEKLLVALCDPQQAANVHRLLGYAQEQVLRLARALLRAGSHCTMIGDSIAGPDVCSPATYRDFAFPYERSLVERLGGQAGNVLGIHICGNATPIIEDMVRTGAAYFELDCKIDRRAVRRATAGRTTLFGTLDPANLLCRGAPAAIEANVKEEIGMLGREGRYVLGPGCTLPWETPFENVRTIVESGREYGRYREDGSLASAGPDRP